MHSKRVVQSLRIQYSRWDHPLRVLHLQLQTAYTCYYHRHIIKPTAKSQKKLKQPEKQNRENILSFQYPAIPTLIHLSPYPKL